MPLADIVKLAKGKQVFIRSNLVNNRVWTNRDERENKKTICRGPVYGGIGYRLA